MKEGASVGAFLVSYAFSQILVGKDYPDFIEKLDRFPPRYGDQYQLPFDCYPEHDDGKGYNERGRPLRRPYFI